MFDEGLSLTSILRAIHNPEERPKWDKEVTAAKTEKFQIDGSLMIWY